MVEVDMSSEGGGMVGMEMETEEEEKEQIENMKDGGGKAEEEVVVRWDDDDYRRDLPKSKMVLTVLLVEDDDSTRQIISALLWKCSYKVEAVSDGLTAWETLKGRPNSIDLILTEVELPSISGFSLLTLVMDHDLYKNIPVIMMSSHNSIGVAFKYMLKGAADFLIKPVRKNELKNLWRHVWKRHTMRQTNDGHVSRNLVVAKHKVEPTSENNAASNQSSNTQSSCTTRYLDPETAYVQNMQVSQLKSMDGSNSCKTDSEMQEECVKLEKASLMPECETGEESNGFRSKGALCNKTCNSAFKKEEDHASAKIMSCDKGVGPESHREKANINSEANGWDYELVEPSAAAIDLIGSFETRPKCAYGQSAFGDGTNNSSFTSELELSLTRFDPTGSKNQEINEGHVLNHSNSSPFSRYNNTKTSPPLFPKLASNCSEPKEDANISHEHTIGTSQWYRATLNKGGQYMTTLPISPSGKVELAIPSPQPKIIHVPGVSLSPLMWSPPKAAGLQKNAPFQISSAHDSNPEIQNLQQGYLPFSDSTNNSTDRTVHELEINLEFEELRHGSPATCQSNSSSLCNGVVNQHNSSAYGSICSRSDCNVTAASASVTMTPEGVIAQGFLNLNELKGTDCHRSVQREAALAKFRLKRKERCYDKKVRYQSRKILAEQRPRVKGQFVRQVQFDTPTANTDSCS